MMMPFGRSRYERFYSVRINYERENVSLRRRSSGMPLKELSLVKLRRLTREHLSKNVPKSSKIHNYTRRAHVLRDVSNAFRVRTCNTRAKENPMEAVRDSSIILRFEKPTSRKSAKSNRKTRCFF